MERGGCTGEALHGFHLRVGGTSYKRCLISKARRFGRILIFGRTAEIAAKHWRFWSTVAYYERTG